MSRPAPIRWRDAAVPALLAVLAAVEMGLAQPTRWGYGLSLELLACAVLAGRVAHPMTAGLLAPLLVVAIPWIGPQFYEASVPVGIVALAMYTLGRRLDLVRGLLGVAVTLSGYLVGYLVVDPRVHGMPDVLLVGAIVLPPFLGGRLAQRLAEQKRLLEEHQRLVRQRAARDERDRIAREVHDLIAHSVSAMVVQVAAAQDLVETDPARVEHLLSDVAETGRRALEEAAGLLPVLVGEGDRTPMGPTPGLADLPTLVEQFRTGGLEVDLDLREPLPALPAGVDVSAYRIVQEALTNALRYGADRTAALRVSGTATVLSIVATNPWDGAQASHGGGLGLVGVAERVSLLGGSLWHGVDDGGRFRLSATLPVGAP